MTSAQSPLVASGALDIPTQREPAPAEAAEPQAPPKAAEPQAPPKGAEPQTPPKAAEPQAPPKASEPVAHPFRGDVAGLRAVAVGLVLLYHAGVPFLPGGFVGVDVFFVISGFLITGQLLKEVERTGRVSLAGFYARRAKRILPAAAIVLVATAGLVWRFAPRTLWEDTAGDIVSAALYVVNWRFSDRAVDYLAEHTQPSPVQHFWSLAVEEQFYIVWPLLIILAVLASRLLRSGIKPTLWVALLVVLVPSFVWSVLETASSPAQAFFASTTRMWELAVGAGVALAGAACARIPRPAAITAGWLGLAAVVAAGVLVTAETAWPGHAAALPTLGTAAVLAAGAAAGRSGPVALLGIRPMRWVGDLSYSLYLWHWPLLMVATAHWQGLSTGQGLAITAASVVPAWLTYRLVENPLRYSTAISGSSRLALSLGANFTLVGVSAGLALMLVFANVSTGPSLAEESAPVDGPVVVLPPVDVALPPVLTGGPERRPLGAGVLGINPLGDPRGQVTDRVPVMFPEPLVARQDLPDTYRDKCHQSRAGAKLLSCTFGDPSSTTEVVLAGDSKVEQWLPAFQMLAAKNRWKIVTYIKSSCGFASAEHLVNDIPGRPYPTCTEWNRALLAKLVADRPEYVVTSQYTGTAADGAGQQSVEAMVAGMRTSWTALTEVGTKVILLANTPDPGMIVYECIDQNRNRLSACVFDRARHDADRGYRTQREAASGTGVPVIDLFDAICPVGPCAPVIGNVIVYRESSHLTATYVRTMAPRLAVALTGAGLPTG
ncbi:acyltransferase family protein [Catellatospora sichuanensis]|uniref:acyltransferase family protein n=1 Tax=Catellatospora sichuanensis TaxID=1969805 RepID=UPI0011821B88|nr:acyltransferase family protein [Catellatospora sichuanensis]